MTEVTRGREGRGQGNVLGVVLLLGITVVGVTAILAFGASAITDSRESSRTMGVEHAMAQLDSKIAMVALGDSDSQSVEFFDAGDGRYEIRSDAGWVNITHRNYSSDADLEVETIVNATLGAVVYDAGDREIAYQAGGVWRYRDNGSVMVSPPEFHYRGSTLTFPVIGVEGNASVSGRATAEIEPVEPSRRLYPNASASYDGVSKLYLNPIEQGNVTIELHSRYYQAWAEYFRERTQGAVSEFHGNDTVRVTLVSRRTLGDFEMPAEGNAIEIRGMSDGHAIDSFTLTLKSSNLNNLHWSLHASSGNRKFEVHIHSPDNCDGGYSADLDVSVFYYNGSGGYHEWQNQSVDAGSGGAFQVDCSGSDGEIIADLTGSTNLTMGDIAGVPASGSQWYYGSEINDNTASSPVTFDQHSADGNTDYTTGDEESLGFLVNHYIALLGSNVDLQVADGPGGSSRVNEGDSSGNLDYGTSGGSGFLTFLHVTENRVEIDID